MLPEIQSLSTLHPVAYMHNFNDKTPDGLAVTKVVESLLFIAVGIPVKDGL